MSASAPEFQRQFVRLFQRTSALCAVLALAYFFRVPLIAGGTSFFTMMFTGSAAMMGAVVALILAAGHFAFWSRAKWTGSDFGPEANRFLKFLNIANALGAAGSLFLFVSLIAQAKQRGFLDHMLGVVTCFLILVIASHKGCMQAAAERSKGKDESFDENMVQFFGSMALVAPIAEAVFYHTNFGVLAAIFGGVVIAVLGFFVMRAVRLPEVGDCPVSATELDEKVDGVTFAN